MSAYGTIVPGLVSVTFRGLPPREVIDLARQAHLSGIEWGGDVHVPHGDLEHAGEVRELMHGSGLFTSAYGSYYRVGESEDEGLPFETVLRTAVELGAPTIRVWAGSRGSSEASPGYRNLVVRDSQRIASMAAASGVTISYEFHGGTLADTGDATLSLLKEVDYSNIYTFWQPTVGASMEYCRRELEQVLPRLTNMHVFHWWPDHMHRRPLSEGGERWRHYLEAIQAGAGTSFASIEFVRGDDPEQFLKDAETLRGWLTSGIGPSAEDPAQESAP